MNTYYEVEEYIFPIKTKEEAMKIAKRISTIRKKAIRILEISNGIVKEIKL